MVSDLRELLRDNVTSPPPDRLDVGTVVGAGRRRVRRRRGAAVGLAALATAAVVALASVLTGDVGAPEVAGEPPAPDAPTLTLADAVAAVAGRDYRELASYTNQDLNADNGQYLDGVTDDGLILFRDGPRADQLYPRFALMDPATGKKDWLPQVQGLGQNETWPVQLGTDRLVLLAGDSDVETDAGMLSTLVAYTFDRNTGRWSQLRWPALPAVVPWSHVLGPNGRVYVRTPATRPGPPPGGWPTGADGEADDSDGEGETNHLWSVSLTDPADVRDEGLTFGDLAFTESQMIWTDSRNGHAGKVHVRDLRTSAEHAFDPHAGKRCNLLSFGASGDRIVMGEFCGEYGKTRDDRVQILTTDGDQVRTIQGDGIDGGLLPGSAVATVTVFGGDDAGTYAYDLASDRLLRLSEAMPSWTTSIAATSSDRQLAWTTPVNGNNGATQHLAELLP